jgi:hypothetical protein
VTLRIASLWEIMRDFDAWGVAILLGHIDRNRALAQKMCDLDGSNERLVGQQLEASESIVHLALHHAERASLQSTHDRVWNNGPFAMALAIGITWQQLVNELTVLRQTTEADLEKHKFAFVLPAKADVMAEMLNWSEIRQSFASAIDDIDSAAECYALEQNTACVFHLMRVAEQGLRSIAKKAGVKLTDKGKRQPIEFATWDKVIAGIRSEIAKARTLPQGPRKNRKLQFYSDAAENCAYIRDVWRNEVSHTRKNYNDGEASGVINRVKDFMQLLATGKS